MKINVPFSFIFIVVLLTTGTAAGQLRSKPSASFSYSIVPKGKETFLSQKWSLPGLNPDTQTNFKPSIPYLSMPVNTTALMGDSYWMGSVTRQSYNQGKIGRYYYWDLQGNLRGSYLFLDIAGKNKRGLKLVFPRHRSLF